MVRAPKAGWARHEPGLAVGQESPCRKIPCDREITVADPSRPLEPPPRVAIASLLGCDPDSAWWDTWCGRPPPVGHWRGRRRPRLLKPAQRPRFCTRFVQFCRFPQKPTGGAVDGPDCKVGLPAIPNEHSSSSWAISEKWPWRTSREVRLQTNRDRFASFGRPRPKPLCFTHGGGRSGTDRTL